MTENITVVYSSIDGCRIKKTFKTLAGAQKFAFKYVGEDAEIGSSYAVSWDGVGKVEVWGASLNQLFKRAVKPTHALDQDFRDEGQTPKPGYKISDGVYEV